MGLIVDRKRILSEYPSCYACEAKTTSREHAPPLCFFPKDPAFRKNLITVPSCDLHNSRRSKDDEYALWHLAGLEGVNNVGEMLHQKLYRVRQHDLKRGGKFMGLLTREVVDPARRVAVLDSQRMIRVLENCARALYFYETLKKLTVKLRVASVCNDFENVPEPEWVKAFETEMAACPVLGKNPEVFTYSIYEHELTKIINVRMVFYGKLKHWVFFHPFYPQQKLAHSALRGPAS